MSYQKAPFQLSPPVFQSIQARPTWYTSTFYTTTRDYRGCPRCTLSRNPSSTNDKDLARCLPGSADSPQICKIPGQEGAGRFFCVSGTRSEPRPRGPRESTLLKTFCQKLMTKAITPCHSIPGSVGYDLFMPINFTIQFSLIFQ